MLQVRGSEVTLEEPSETSGDAVITWTVVDTVRALIEGASGSGTALDWESDVRILIAYRADVTPHMQIGYGTRKFRIVSPPVPDMWRKQLLIVAQERV